MRTEGPDGYPHEYDVAYTFGVDPLQQYLIAFPGGRLQALGIAWDSRPKEQGGQRWFALYPDQRLRAARPAALDRADQTWNYQCADCHSTDLRKNFDLAANSYATTWSDVDVACEACHGAGVQPRRLGAVGDPPPADPAKGLANRLRPTDGGVWAMDPATGIARRTAPLASAELDTCAPCHARRKPLVATPPPAARRCSTAYLPALLEPGLYFADGQIDGEVFEYGSFVQSRMHRAGVTCSNCHEPHGLKLRAEGNAVCAQCHMPARFDTRGAHHHAPGSAGAQCVACHMPTQTYMIVHAAPRPQHPGAAARPVGRRSARRTPARLPRRPAGRLGGSGRRRLVSRPAGRRSRNSAPPCRPAAPGRRCRTATRRADPGRDPAADRPRQRPAAARPGWRARRSVPASPPRSPIRARSCARRRRALCSPALTQAAARAALALLADPVRAVRIEAARALAGRPTGDGRGRNSAALDAAMRELVAAELVDADRPESHLNLGLLSLRAGQPAEAEQAYRTALRLDPDFVPALVNLADLDRMRGRDQRARTCCAARWQSSPASADAGTRSAWCWCASTTSPRRCRYCARRASWRRTTPATPMSMPLR